MKSANGMAVGSHRQTQIAGPRWGGGMIKRISNVLFLLVIGAAQNAQAQTYSILHNFTSTGGDGADPHAGLIMDKAGDLYGTTLYGGSSTNCGIDGCGTVFRLDPSGNETVLYNFTNSNGDGANPHAGLIMDSSGNLYGTTMNGGTSGYGTVFELVNSSGNYSETVLHSFGGSDGANPWAGLITDSSGNLYGTTTNGGTSGYGTVFELVNSSGNYSETVLHSFALGDGAHPFGGLIRDLSGNLYGTAESGGNVSLNNGYGYGTVFKVDTFGNFTVLHNFSGADGSAPLAGLIMDSSGNLYGTTAGGGASVYYGTALELDAAGNEIVLHSFTGGSDGAFPYAGLTLDPSGNLYGMTEVGGSFSNCTGGCGTVFGLAKASGYAENVLHTFSITDGDTPDAGLIRDASGNLYGTTAGSAKYGVVFKLAPPATTRTLSSSANPATAGDSITFTATVDSSFGTPTGTVTLSNGLTTLGTQTLSSGQATFTIEDADSLGVGTFTIAAQDNPDTFGFGPSSATMTQNVTESGIALTSGSNTFTGSQTVNGTVAATAFTGNGTGLTNVLAVGLNCAGCVGNPRLGIDYAGSASQGGPATSAISAAQATTALNALNLGGEPITDFAMLATPNTFTAVQTMPSLYVTGAAGLSVTGPAQTGSFTTGSITIGGGTAVAEFVSVTFPVTLPAINSAQCTTLVSPAVTGFIPGTSDTIALGLPASLLSLGASSAFLMYEAWEITTNSSPTITIQVCNPSASRYKGGDFGTIRADIIKH